MKTSRLSYIGLMSFGVGALLTIAAIALPSVASAQYTTSPYMYGGSYNNVYYGTGYYQTQYPDYNYTYQNSYPYGYNSYYTGSSNTVSTPYWCGSYWSSQPCNYSYSNSGYTYPGYGNQYYSNQNYWQNKPHSYYKNYNTGCPVGYYLWGTNCWINPSSNQYYQQPLMYSLY